ncbi:MAG TPA: hypothetical protein ENJ09_06405 [Planctomycetes bacterium]|nr:hypothetical protein [Planctomycetota bacterium]
METTEPRPSRARRILGHLLFLVAVLLACAGLALLIAEETGLLTGMVQRGLAWRFGPLGDGLEVDAVRLRWFEPGVDLSGIRLNDEDGENLLRLDRVHLALHPSTNAPIDHVRVEGGWVRISTALVESLDRFAEEWAGEETDSDSGRAKLPSILVTDFRTEIDLELPGESSIVRVGSVDLEATPSASGYLQIQGRLTPDLSGAVDGTGAIRVLGQQNADGSFLVRAVADALNLETSGFHMPPSLGPLPVEAFGGRLSLAASARISFEGDFEISGNLRARLFDAHLQPRRGDPWLEDLTIDLDSRLALSGGRDLWDRDLWDTAVRLRTRWAAEDDPSLATPVEIWGLFGKRVPRGAWARCFARARTLPLDERVLVAAGATPAHRDLWESWNAFSPEGNVDVSMDAVIRRERLEGAFRYPITAALFAQSRGSAGICFAGFPDEGPRARPGDKLGIPQACTTLNGQAALTFDAERARRWRLAIPRVHAKAGAADAEGWAFLSERDDDTGLLTPYLDCEFRVAPFALDETWLGALSASPLTRDIVRDYRPTAGTVSTRWFLHDGPESYGLTAQGDVQLEDASLAWSPLPIPIQGASGSVRLRWGRRASRVEYAEGEYRRGLPLGVRSFGVAWDIDNSQGVGTRDVAAHVRGFVRDVALPDPTPLPDPAEIPLFWALDVDVQGLGLRGQNAQLLEAFLPEFGPQRDELEARGRIDVHYESVQASETAPYIAHVEVTPREVEVTPRVFPRRTTDLVGRVLARVDFGGLTENEEAAIDARGQLTGSWPQGVALGSVLNLSGDTLDITVVGAGPDPEDPGLKGAVAAALSRDQPGASGVDFSESSFKGFIDFIAHSKLRVDDPEAEAETDFHLFLRNCSLLGGSLRLDDLNGRLDQSAEVLRAERILASLAGHRVELLDVALFPVEAADQVPGSDELLERAAPRGRASGLVTQVTLRSVDLPMDSAHIERVLGPEAAAALPGEDEFQALLDIEDAKVLLATTEDGESVVALSGKLRPHDLSLTFGLPITVHTADVHLEEMVIERGGVRAWASIENLDADIAERELKDARMILALVDKRLTVDDLDGTFVGGRLRSLGASGIGSRKALGVDLALPHRFDLALSLEDVHIDRLLRGIFQSSIADAGLLRASLELSGTPEDVLGLNGRGRMRLTKGRLWSIPAARALFARLGFPDTAVFDQLDARFEVRDGVIDTHHMLVKSSLLKLYGKGALDLDGALSFDLDVRYGILDRLGLITRLIYWLNRNLVRVAIRGDFLRPEVNIRSSLLELFGGRPAKRARGLPLPGFAPLGDLF